MSISETINKPFTFDKQLEDDFLTEYCDGDLDFCLSMFEVFLETVSKEILQLSTAISVRDFSKISEIAHRVKSNFAYVGFSRDGESLSLIDAAAKSDQVHPDANQTIELIKSHIIIIEKENIRLSAYLQS